MSSWNMQCSWKQTTPVQCFSAEAVSSPMRFAGERVPHFKGEIKKCFFTFQYSLLFLSGSKWRAAF